MLFQRKRDMLVFFPWLVELLIATAFLLLEGGLQIFWYILPIWKVQEFFVNKYRKHLGPDDPALNYDFMQLVRSHGYNVEEHYVETKDGYILGIHRVLSSETQNNRRILNSPNYNNFKGVAFFQHGFMQSSEAWIARGPGKALVYNLVDQGYDVWLGNNRGNKYSYKHVKYSTHSDKFWNFSLDDFAMYDIPTMIEFVLNQTGSPSLFYIGFSQGTAQAFAAFSLNPNLASKINLFVALAPATRVKELKNPVVSAVATSRPKLVFLLFGKRAILGETLFWRSVLSWQVYAWVIDFFLEFLFGWKTRNLDSKEKPMLYAHLYSYSSVKCLVHWFQIAKSQNFQAFDDNIIIRHTTNYKPYVLPNYSPSRIVCPVAIFYGGKDTVPEMNWLLKQVPEGTFIHCEDSYEHLDFMWAKDAPDVIDKKVIDLLGGYNQQSKIGRQFAPDQGQSHTVRG